MNVLDELYELLELELKKLVKKETLTPVEIDNASKAVCLMEKIKNLQNGSYDQYEGSSGRRMRNPMNGRYMGDQRGYSGHSIKDRMVDRLESMMDEAHSDYERQVIADWIAKIQN
jgi:hypothetical protein